MSWPYLGCAVDIEAVDTIAIIESKKIQIKTTKNEMEGK